MWIERKAKGLTNGQSESAALTRCAGWYGLWHPWGSNTKPAL